MALEEKKLMQCPQGWGTEVRNIRNDPLLGKARIPSEADFIVDNPGLIFLTPTRTAHPILPTAQPFKRALTSWRSFDIETPENGNPPSTVTVKGGDLLYKSAVELHLFRIKKQQIPGSMRLDWGQLEYDNAVVMQRLAIERLGRATFTAFPLSVREIQKIQLAAGDIVGVKDFMNSDQYTPSPEVIKKLGLNESDKLGDLLLDSYGLVPAEYCYSIGGKNLRVSEYASSLYLSKDQKESQSPDQLKQKGIRPYGRTFLRGMSHDSLLRAVYKSIGQDHKLVAEVILPTQKVTGEDWARGLEEARVVFQYAGYSKIILNTFIDQICEVASLGHQAGYTFNSPDVGSGSFAPRNITGAGYVLDLDTFGRFPEEHERLLETDFKEMLLSTQCLSFLFSSSQPNIAADLFAVYSDKLQKVADGTKSAGTIQSKVDNIRRRFEHEA